MYSKIYSRLFIIAYVVLCPSFIQGQELRGIIENPVIKSFDRNNQWKLKSTSQVQAVLSLPFFDDFSYSGIYPDPDLWIDNNVFINRNYPDTPISVGAATFDAIDENGDLYSINYTSVPSDYLTSQPIDLLPYAGSADTVFLSFFYQAMGKGEMPDKTDSLVVDFFSAKDNKWIRIWETPGDSAASFGFTQVILPVHDSLLQSNFQFRFFNYTSIDNFYKSNADHWNVDYVQLDQKTRLAHQHLNEFMYVDPLHSTFRLYEAIPWAHIYYAQFTGKEPYITTRFRNAYQDTKKMTRSYLVKDLVQGTSEIPAEGGNEDFEADSVFERNDYFNSGISYYPADSGKFEIRAYLTTDAEEFRGNDTVTRIEVYSDYYAYDDGTAEFGFGITGESAVGSSLASRFKIYKPDTLNAVDIYFNKTAEDVNTAIPFYISIWKNNFEIPGNKIYNSPEMDYVNPSHGFLQFQRFALDSVIAVSDTIFIGIQQAEDAFLNIGYDVNNSNLANTFINTEGLWYSPANSLREGTLMIRPVFGNKIITGNNDHRDPESNILEIYPNPARDYIRFDFQENNLNIRWNTTIFSLSGKIVYSSAEYKNTIDISFLNPGIYFLKLDNRQKSVTGKFIILP